MSLFTRSVTILTILAAALAGCASQPNAQTPAAQAPAEHAEHAEHAAHAAAPQTSNAPAQVVALPAAPGPGEPREVASLVNQPTLKLVSIVLRAGTVLPEHQSAVPVTIVALRGAGTVVADGKRLRLDATHAVVLEPSVAHAVEPDAGTDLVLLVHHLGQHDEAHHH